jgi:hypothetical protein
MFPTTKVPVNDPAPSPTLPAALRLRTAVEVGCEEIAGRTTQVNEAVSVNSTMNCAVVEVGFGTPNVTNPGGVESGCTLELLVTALGVRKKSIGNVPEVLL